METTNFLGGVVVAVGRRVQGESAGDEQFLHQRQQRRGVEPADVAIANHLTELERRMGDGLQLGTDGRQLLKSLASQVHRRHQSAPAGVRHEVGGLGDARAVFELRFELEARRQFDGLAQQHRLDQGNLAFGRPLELPVFGPGRRLLPGRDRRGELDAEHPQPMKERRAMQIEKRGLFAGDAAVFAQIELDVLRNRGAVFFQLEAGEFAVEVRLDRSLAHSLGQLANGGTDVDLGESIAHDEGFAVADERHRGIAQIAQRRRGAVLQRRQCAGQADALDDLGRRAVRAVRAQMAGDVGKILARQFAEFVPLQAVPEEFEISRGVVAGPVARLRRELEVRIGHQGELARPPPQPCEFVVGHRRVVRRSSTEA